MSDHCRSCGTSKSSEKEKITLAEYGRQSVFRMIMYRFLPTSRESAPNLKDPDHYMASENVFDVAKKLGYWDGKGPSRLESL